MPEQVEWRGCPKVLLDTPLGESEGAFQDFADVVGFAHGVVMDGGCAVCQQIFALGGAPFDAGLIDFLVVLAFPHFVHQVLGQVDAESPGEHFDVSLGGNGF